MIDKAKLKEAVDVATIIRNTIDHKFGEYDETIIEMAMETVISLAEAYLDGRIVEAASEEEIVERAYKYFSKDMSHGVQGGGCDMGAFARMREDCERLAKALVGKVAKKALEGKP